MTVEVDDEVQFEPDRGQIVAGTVTSVQGREPYGVIGARGRGVSENYLIPERHLMSAAIRVTGRIARSVNSPTKRTSINRLCSTQAQRPEFLFSRRAGRCTGVPAQWRERSGCRRSA
jgi:hypothetical protein